MNELWQMLRSISMGELREYFEKLNEIDPAVFESLKHHILSHPPKTYKPYDPRIL